MDIQSEEQVKAAFDQAVSKFGGVDVLVNNASAIHLTGTYGTRARFSSIHCDFPREVCSVGALNQST